VVRVEGLTQISAHVHIIPDNSVPLVPNVGYVIGDRAALVIDTGLGPRNGSAVYEVAKKLARAKALYLVTTHFHPEHDLGAQAFPQTTSLIRSVDQVKEIAESGLQLAKVFASRSSINAELLKDADFRKVDITFERDYDLDLGGVHAKLTAMGPDHTRVTRSSGSSPNVSCSPATSPCAPSRPLPVPIQAFATGLQASTGWSSSSPLSSYPVTVPPATGPLSSPGIAPILRRCATARPRKSEPARGWTKRWRRSRRPLAIAPRTRRVSPVRSRRLTPRRHECIRSQ